MAELLTKPGGGEERLTFCMSSLLALAAAGADLRVKFILVSIHPRY